jgi:hypothetical protein
MPITVTDFEEKKYTIADAEFKLKKPTLGIKRKGAALASILVLKLQELSAVSANYLREVNSFQLSVDSSQLPPLKGSKNKSRKGNNESIDVVDASVYQKLCEVAEQINKLNEEVFVKAEELFKIILEPVNPEDGSKLIADNLDENIITQVVQDFFQLAGLLMKPANN